MKTYLYLSDIHGNFEALKHLKDLPEMTDPDCHIRFITEDQLKQIESSQPTDLYYKALKEPANISQETKIFSPNRFSTYLEEK